jgi:hypothetical protein
MNEYFVYAALAGMFVTFGMTIYDLVKLRDLVTHMWVHDGYRRNGYDKMTRKQRALYDSIVGKEGG